MTKTHTLTPTSSETASPTASKTSTPRPTVIPFTATATATPQLSAPVFADTPIWEFASDVFINDLAHMHLVIQSLSTASSIAQQLSTDCLQFARGEIHSAHGFANVSDNWQALYYEYRALLHQAESVLPKDYGCLNATPVRPPPNVTSVPVTSLFDAIQNRLYQMISEAQALK